MSMPQRLGVEATPGEHVFAGVALGMELSLMRSIDPEESTSRRTFGRGRWVVPAICALASLPLPRIVSDTAPIAPRSAKRRAAVPVMSLDFMTSSSEIRRRAGVGQARSDGDARPARDGRLGGD